ncbi:hypothetical protein [Yinghuangia sp. YIM S09857]|uniref:hypothetical protein n=1 Tax=Yinghuangia sp. YIM S09857 TaxID=3436929 RepID=UPI003F52FA62
MSSATRGRPRRALALLGVFGATALLAACGIRETEGPINAGEPAKRPQGTATSPVLAMHSIYLVRNGRPAPVLRGDAVDLPVPGHNSTRQPGPGDPLRMSLIDRLLRELARGPNAEEAAAGWTTRLPTGGVRLAEPVTDDPAVLIRLDLASVTDLDPLALGQVVCTLEHAGSSASVLLAGRTGPGRALTCAAFEDGPIGPIGAEGGPTASASSSPTATR